MATIAIFGSILGNKQCKASFCGHILWSLDGIVGLGQDRHPLNAPFACMLYRICPVPVAQKTRHTPLLLTKTELYVYTSFDHFDEVNVRISGEEVAQCLKHGVVPSTNVDYSTLLVGYLRRVLRLQVHTRQFCVAVLSGVFHPGSTGWSTTTAVIA